MTTRNVFISCSPGFEKFLQEEVIQLLSGKSTNIRMENGGVEIDSLSDENLWKLCHTSLLGESIRVRIGQEGQRIRFKGEFISHLKKLPFHAYLNEKSRPTVKVVCHQSKLYHSDMLREMIEDYFVRRFSSKPKNNNNNNNNNDDNNQKSVSKNDDLDLDLIEDDDEFDEFDELDLDLLEDDNINNKKHKKREPFVYKTEGLDTTQTVYALMNNNRLQMSLSAASFLHRRTPNKNVVEAPIRETIAAAIVRCVAPEIEKESVVWDPFCGSGTIISEFRRFELQQLQPQLSQQPSERVFEFQNWKSHKQDLFNQWKQSKFISSNSITTTTSSIKIDVNSLRQLIGTDHDNKAITNAKFNISSSHFGGSIPLTDKVSFSMNDFEAAYSKIDSLKNAKKINIITNLPYGHRLGRNNSQQSLQSFAQFLMNQQREKNSNIRNVFVLSGGSVANQIQSIQQNLKWHSLATFSNRGLPVKLLKLLK